MPRTLDELMRRAADAKRYVRLPGLYRRWEMEQVIEASLVHGVMGRAEAEARGYSKGPLSLIWAWPRKQPAAAEA